MMAEIEVALSYAARPVVRRRPSEQGVWFPDHGAIGFIGLLQREGAIPMAGLFSAARLRRGKSFRRLTGVSVATFEQMVKHLRAGWKAEQRR